MKKDKKKIRIGNEKVREERKKESGAKVAFYALLKNFFKKPKRKKVLEI